MHLRRALLLFAMVLGLAALAATLSQAPRGDGGGRDAASAPPPATEIRGPAQVRVSARGRPRTVRLRAGESTVLIVSVAEPGQVEVAKLGLIAPADPSTPASFPLRPEPGRYPVLFTPAGSQDARRIGALLARR